MTTFIEVHALRSFPPSNLNRDDLGTPKTAVFGGSRRLRISSQCLKRTWRTSEEFRGRFAEDQLGVRTDRLPDEVLKQLDADEETFGEPAREVLLAVLTSIGKKKKGVKDEDEDEDADDAGGDEPEAQVEARTPHLLFLSRQEIEAVAAFAREKKTELAKAMKIAKGKPKLDQKAVDKLRGELQAHLVEHTSRNAVDIGLFGRFVTSDELDTVEGALQVAHALGTQKVEVEYDYFTAVDDLGDTTGAGHLGETEFASSVLYLYACCDLEQLEQNLGKRLKKGRETDPEASKLARLSLPVLVKALAQATPKGKRTGTAPNTPAEYVEVVVRRGRAPLSFANAFLKPVEPREVDGDVMAGSIARLRTHRDRLEKAYGSLPDARFVLDLRTEPPEKGPPPSTHADLEALAVALGKALDAPAT